MKRSLPPCPAGLDPASHPIKAVGTQRVALNSVRMGLRVKARNDTNLFGYTPFLFTQSFDKHWVFARCVA